VSTTAFLAAHWPSLKDEDEATLIDRMGVYLVDEDTTVADFAVRTCACGFKIDGFDEFMFHLTELARKEEL